MSTKVLIIDDDTALTSLLTDFLGRFEYDVQAAATPAEGMEKLRTTPPDIVILDIMLPEKNGFEVCREIRSETQVPIVILSARGQVNDRIVGLELGADDYLPKPFEPRELVARIQSVMRRVAEKGEIPAAAPRLIADAKHRRFSIGGTPLELTTTEYELLALFVERAGQILSRQDIVNHLRGVEWNVFDRTIDVLVSRLRGKLNDDPRRPRYLQTVWGKGYLFTGEVTRADA